MKYKLLEFLVIMVLLLTACQVNDIKSLDYKESTSELTDSSKNQDSDSKQNLETDKNINLIQGESQSAEISVKLEKDFPKNTVFYDYIADITENSIIIVLSANKQVKNFRFLSLEFTDVSKEEKVEFNTHDLYKIDTLSKGTPFRVKLTMFGTIPNYGISYLDENGIEKKFSIQQSGKDGSIILVEF